MVLLFTIYFFIIGAKHKKMKKYIVKRLNKKYIQEMIIFYKQLDDETIYNRFCSHVSMDFIEKYIQKLEFQKNGIFGILNENNNIIGIGECILFENHHQYDAEVGFVVNPQYQGKGLGNELMKRIIRFSKIHNAKILQMYCLKTNNKSLHLAKKYGLKPIITDGEALAKINIHRYCSIKEKFKEQLEDIIAGLLITKRRILNNWK